MTKRNWPIIQSATCDNLFKPDTKTLTKRIWTCEIQPSSGGIYNVLNRIT